MMTSFEDDLYDSCDCFMSMELPKLSDPRLFPKELLQSIRECNTCHGCGSQQMIYFYGYGGAYCTKQCFGRHDREEFTTGHTCLFGYNCLRAHTPDSRPHIWSLYHRATDMAMSCHDGLVGTKQGFWPMLGPTRPCTNECIRTRSPDRYWMSPVYRMCVNVIENRGVFPLVVKRAIDSITGLTAQYADCEHALSAVALAAFVAPTPHTA